MKFKKVIEVDTEEIINYFNSLVRSARNDERTIVECTVVSLEDAVFAIKELESCEQQS